MVVYSKWTSACSLLVILFQVALMTGSVFNNVSSSNKTTGQDGETGKSLLRFIQDRWTNREDLAGLLTNTLGHNQQANQNIKLKQEYACGRSTLLDKRPKDQLPGNDLATNEINLFGLPKNKYRPTEIRMPRIIGGDETSPGEFPWTASVKLNGQPICGGSLIERSWILTAAHCVVGYNPKNLTIRLGAYRIKDSTETQIVDMPISLFIVHKEYSMPRPFSNDIALLKLIEPVDYTDYIIPICLPNEDQTPGAGQTQIGANVHNSADYNMKKLGNGNAGLSAITTAESDSGGIVVSTKMSDSDIAKCFNRIEQNYLNSIGLGAVDSEAAVTKEPGATNNQGPHTTAPSSTPRSVANSLPTPSPPDFSLSIETLVDLLDPSYDVQRNDQTQKVHIVPSNAAREKVTYTQKHVDSRPSTVYQSVHHETAPSHQSLIDSLSESSYQASGTTQGSNYAVYYDLPWARRRNVVDVPNDSSRHDSIKLSKLAVSKELLREIQSLGTSSMQNLGLHHGEIIAMANDLTSNVDEASKLQESLPRPTQSQPHSSTYGTRHTNNILRSPVIDLDETIGDPSRYSGVSGIVVGWGWVREQDGDEFINKGYPSVTLQKVKLPILRNNVCEAWFQSQAKKITLLPSQFCAGFNSGGKDACRGDSGGPMIIEDAMDSGRYQLIGIVSAGIGCARPSLPGLYTRVASFLPWIRTQINRYET